MNKSFQMFFFSIVLILSFAIPADAVETRGLSNSLTLLDQTCHQNFTKLQADLNALNNAVSRQETFSSQALSSRSSNSMSDIRQRVAPLTVELKRISSKCPSAILNSQNKIEYKMLVADTKKLSVSLQRISSALAKKQGMRSLTPHNPTISGNGADSVQYSDENHCLNEFAKNCNSLNETLCINCCASTDENNLDRCKNVCHAAAAACLITNSLNEALKNSSSLSSISSEDLLSAFTKLNVENQTQNPDVQSDQNAIKNELRKRGLEHKLPTNTHYRKWPDDNK